MFRIAIVEDEDACARLLEDYIRRYGETAGDAFRTDRFPNGLEFIENYRPVYDVILMDIRMPLVDGMGAARRLRAQDEETALIFVTNMAQYAIKGYEVQALDFMLKPVQYYDFEMKFSKAIRYCRKRSAAALSFEAGGTVHRVPARDVSCVEVMNHSLLYHVGDAVYEVYGQLKTVEEQLAGGDFVRCSQSHLVNLRHVTEVRAASVVVGGREVPLSRRKRKEFLQALADYMGGGF